MTSRRESPSSAPRPRTTWQSTLAGLGTSLLVHVVLIVAAGLIFLPQIVRQELDLITVTEAESDDFAGFEELVDLSVASSSSEPPPGLTTLPVQPIAVDTNALLGGAVEAAPAGKPDKAGSGDGLFADGSSRLLQPGNAVTKGRFAAWTVPIGKAGEPPPKPGDAPRPYQPYFVVVQMRVPETYRTYPASDLMGSITGTDGYVLKLPKRTYYYNLAGELKQVSTRSRIPVQDEMVQMLVRVPGASDAGVRDEIALESRRLDESETLSIEFAADETGT